MLEVEACAPARAEDFANSQWPRYNEEAKIGWDFFRGGMQVTIAGKSVGALTYNVSGGVGHLGQVIVDFEARHQGIGTRLLAGFEQDCMRRACHRLSLECGEWQAWDFFEKRGWSVFHVLENDKMMKRGYLMEKLLPK